jgi:DNA-binding MarR family transcriptional regulator
MGKMVGQLGREIGKIEPFDSLEQEVFLNCLKTADWLSRGGAALLKSAGLSITQYNVLRILRGVGPTGISCQEIANRMITRDPDLTRLLDRLEKRGMVRRERQYDDRRVIKAYITEEGLTLLAGLDKPIAELHKRLLSHMGPERLNQFLQLLEEARQTQDGGSPTPSSEIS